MTKWRFPIWLLRDVPAFLAVVTSFWPLVILVIASGRRAMRGQRPTRAVIDLIADLLVRAEIRLNYAISREACRRLGWDHRTVQHLNVAIPTGGFPELVPRIQRYREAFANMEACVRAYVEIWRAQHNIRARDLVAHGSTDARLRRAAHHELVGASRVLRATSPLALIPSSTRSMRPSKDERSYAHARGPPQRVSISGKPNSQAPPARTHRHAYLPNSCAARSAK